MLKISNEQVALSKYQTLISKINAFNPRGNATASATDNLQLPTNYLPAQIFGGVPGTFKETQFGHFGIYNILNMTIMEKLNDIAILKAIGFSGKDVIRIFVKEAIVIGLIGIAFGLLLAMILVKVMGNMWVGRDIGFFPIRFFPKFFGLGIGFGLIVTTLAGYIPARKAAKLDPITIFRK